MVSTSSYMAELFKGEEIAVTVHPNAAGVLREVERAKADGWTVDRIERDEILINEAELRALAAAEAEPAPRNP